MMHQMLRDMGREIIRQQSPKEPGKRSRVWHYKDSFNVLSQKTGTGTLEGLVFDMNMLKEDESGMTIFDTNNSKRRRFKEFIDKSLMVDLGDSLKRRRTGFFSWHRVNTDLKSSNEIDLKTDAFSVMHKLRLLQINYVKLTGGYEEFPKNLRWLCWRGFSLKSIPSHFPLDSLVAIDMRNSCLERVWDRTRQLRLLKILNFSHSHCLIRTPDFTEVPHLERLILKDCVSLFEVDKSIGYLKTKLVLLNLKDCKKLRTLPEEICMLKVLETLIISGCSNLEELPMEMRKMESLKVFCADGIAINGLPSTIGEDASSWHAFIWSWVSKPRKFPELSWVSLPQSLVSLSLAGCNLSDNAFPRDFSHLPLLQNLNLSKNPILSLPDCIKGLTRLSKLELYSCTRLEALIGLPRIHDLSVGSCTSLERITYKSTLWRAKVYFVNGCEKLVDMEGNFKVEPARDADAETVNSLGLHYLESMKSFKVNLYNNSTDTQKKGPIQVLYEKGLFSIFLPGSKSPNWFSYRNAGSSVSFTVPSVTDLRIRGLNICCVYAIDKKNWTPGVQFYTIISNLTKDLKLIYGPTCYGLPEADDEYMIWFSYWKFQNQLEAGDELNVLLLTMPGFEIKEVGAHLVYEEQEQMGTPSNRGRELIQQNHPSDQDVIPPHQVAGHRGNTRLYALGHLGVSLDYLLPDIP